MTTTTRAPYTTRPLKTETGTATITQAVHVLLVANNSGEAETIHSLLARPEYGAFEVTHVLTLHEVPSALERCRPDAVLVDMGLTGENDPTILTQLRRLVEDMAIPIVALTGRDNDLQSLRSRHPEAEDFLIKGLLDQGALPRVIHNVLERQTLMANLHRMILHNPDGIVVVNDTGYVLFANPAAARLFDRPVSDLLDEQFGFPVIGNETVEVDISGERIAEMRVVEINWLNQPAFLTSLRDITEHKRTERRLQDAKIEADHANRSKSEFLAYMSHELRTPLTSILGFSEMIQLEILGPLGVPEYREYADAVRTSGHHLLQIVNDILDLAAVEVGKLELHYEIVDLGRVVSSTVRLVDTLALAKNIRLVNAMPADLPYLTADSRRIQQILLNLLANAIKFTPTGGVVTIEGRNDDSAGGALLLTVTDTGVGISAEDIAKLMEPFSRVGKPISRQQQGTGLGLHLSHNLAQLFGGSLLLESAPGKGTKVTLRFPPKLVVRD
ncbi:two-component system, cell cycle sensor histidine kinase PleC [Azospirillaceae bacterium]